MRCPLFALILIVLAGCEPINTIIGDPEPDESHIQIDDEFVEFGIHIHNFGDTILQWKRLSATPCRSDGQHWSLSPLLDTSCPQFSGYDTTLIRVTDSLIIPLREGWTPVRVSFPTYHDDIGLAIERINGRLVVDFDHRALRNARFRYLYTNSIWDTLDGTTRAAAVARITPGMALGDVRNLLNGARHYYSRRYRQTLFASFDRERGVYIEYDSDRVVRAWIDSTHYEWDVPQLPASRSSGAEAH